VTDSHRARFGASFPDMFGARGLSQQPDTELLRFA